MLEIANQEQPAEIRQKVSTLQMSALDTGLDDNSVDVTFCMRLIHHIGQSTDRISILKEFARVSRRHVVLSLWVDGNYQSYRRHRLEARRTARKYQNRFVLPADVFDKEVQEAGLRIVASFDLLPCVSMWRTYVLEVPSDE